MSPPDDRPTGIPVQHRDICEQLRQMASWLGPWATFPHVAELARQLSIAPEELEIALNELISDGILVCNADGDTCVSPTLRPRSIHLLCDASYFRGSISPFWQMMIEGTHERALSKRESFNFHVVLPDCSPDSPLPNAFVHEVEAGRVDGVLGMGLVQPVADWLTANHVPYVSFSGCGECALYVDVGYLIDLGVNTLAEAGCRRIGLWQPAWTGRPPEDVESSAQRSTKHFETALAKRAIPYQPELVRTNTAQVSGGKPTSQTHQEQGYRTALDVLGPASAARPDGVVIVDDMMTHGALVALGKLGVTPGDELRIATNANRGSSVLLGREDQLIMIETDPAEVVATMFRLLDTLMSGQAPATMLNIIRPQLRRNRRGGAFADLEETRPQGV